MVNYVDGKDADGNITHVITGNAEEGSQESYTEVYENDNTGFSREEGAAVAWCVQYGQKSIDNSREESSLIYQTNEGSFKYTQARYWNNDVMKDKKYDKAHSSPGPKALMEEFAEELKNATVVAHIHSHGAFSQGSDEEFSTWRGGIDQTDWNFDIRGTETEKGMATNNPDLNFYLFTPTGLLYKYDAINNFDSDGNQHLISGGFYYDKHDKKLEEYMKTHPARVTIILPH